jgi:hypothetical protein
VWERLVIALGLLGCNTYDLFRVAGPDPTTPTKVDLLFVVDDSESMREEAVTLAEGFSEFVASLGGGGSGLVDYRLALTTTDAEGRAGALLGDRPILAEGEPDVAERFVETLLCEASCFSERRLVDSDPGFTCRERGTFGGRVSQQSLDCLCGEDAWLGHCGGGTEAPLEAVLDAMCRTSPDGPDELCNKVPAAERGAVEGFLRPGAALVPVVVTDEGDGSPRIPVLEASPEPYGKAYARFGTEDEPVQLVWAVIGPELTEDYEPRCPGLSTSWGVMRLRYLAQDSGGLYEDVFTQSCGPKDLSGALSRVGELVERGGGAVVLPSEPRPGSLAVVVGNRGVDAAVVEREDVFGAPVWSDGWEYRAETRTVILHGDARPTGDEDVSVFFLPR